MQKLIFSKVSPGDVIDLQPGTYIGKFGSTLSGTQNNPITLKGSRNSILTNPDNDGFALTGSSWWILNGY